MLSKTKLTVLSILGLGLVSTVSFSATSYCTNYCPIPDSVVNNSTGTQNWSSDYDQPDWGLYHTTGYCNSCTVSNPVLSQVSIRGIDVYCKYIDSKNPSRSLIIVKNYKNPAPMKNASGNSWQNTVACFKRGSKTLITSDCPWSSN